MAWEEFQPASQLCYYLTQGVGQPSNQHTHTIHPVKPGPPSKSSVPACRGLDITLICICEADFEDKAGGGREEKPE